MSFRFSERRRRPPCSRAGYRPSERAATWAHSSPDPLIMDGFRGEMLNSGVAAQLRLPLRAFLRRPALAALPDQVVGPLGSDPVDRISSPQGGVRLAVGDIGAEATVLEDDRLPAHRVVAELAEGRSGRAAAALPRLGELRDRLVERNREELLLRVQ